MVHLNRKSSTEHEVISHKSASLGEQLRRPGVLTLLLGAGSFLLYCGTLAFKFVYDDKVQVLDDVAITKWRYVPKYFTSDVWSLIDPHKAPNYYRPIFLLWLKVNYSLFGLAPAGWHALCVCLHVLATVQTFWIARRFLRAELPAAVAALLFAVHPVHIESVAWVSGATDPLVTVFMLGAVLGFLRFLDHRRSSNRWLIYIASLVFAALALLSKEVAIMLPVLVTSAALVTQPINRDSRKIWKFASVFFVLTLAYLVARHLALHGFSHPDKEHGIYQLLLTWPSVLAFYARQLIAPFWVSPEANTYWVTSPTLRQFWIPLAICVLLFTIGVIAYRHSRTRALLLVLYGWILLPLVPALYLPVFPPQELVHDRYLYFPTVGFCIVLILAGLKAAEKFGTSILKRMAVVTIAVLAVLTFLGELDWASDLLLFSRAASVAPENDSAVMNLGVTLIKNNRAPEGSELLRLVCRRNPNYSEAAYNLGRFLYESHRDSEAEVLLHRAVTLDPTQEYWLIRYAGVELRLGRVKEAEQAAREALRLNSDGADFHLVLGAVLNAKGDRGGARAAYREELRLHPDNLKAQQALESVDVSD
jgi:Flp pilus assembly protein TadD